MKYQLNQTAKSDRKTSILGAIKRILPYMAGERTNLIVALTAILVSAATSLSAPIIISHTIDTYIQHKDFHGVLMYSFILLGVFAIGLVSSYIQT